ncbi:MAG: hypothetical protein ALECFALPRED_002040 [Alectoria fallacina]|uniref:Glucose-methanol-choline oxidoreductase N-terminal domain-containing protein n=1 Tax=Alectoria fallacina TaxID=1903189 RepID=A0A8H3FCL2_9LECA|nr:MAG: hypothetical protein ALECFALPRED_002040 [Alectoria fallacina]
MADQTLFDYIIVGGGTAGCVIASRLHQGDPSKSILVVERGPDERKHPQITNPVAAPLIPLTTNLVSQYHTVPQAGLAGRSILTLAGNILSGSSAVNYGMWSRGDKADYEQWAKSSGDDRWTYDRMMPYFNRSEHHHDPDADPKVHGFDGPIHTVSGRQYPLRDTVHDAFHAAGYQDNPDANSGNPLGLAKYTENWHKATRQPAGTAYPLKGVKVMTNTTVHTIILKDDPATGNMLATGIEIFSGRQIHARKEVILSCGAHRTPQLLMLSGIGPEPELSKHGIRRLINSHFVGHNLFDHLALGIAWKLKPSIQERVAALGHPEWKNNPSNAEGMPMEWIVHSSVPPSALLPALQADGETLTAPKQLLLKDRVHTMMLVAYGPMAMGPNLSVPIDGSHISTIALLYQPTSRGSITLSSVNPEDPPVVNPAYYFTQADKVMLRSAVRNTLRVVETPAMQKVIECESPPEGYPPLTSKSTDEEIDARVAGFGTTIHHAAGTCAMGNVVDGQLKVKGVNALRIVDASVFPAPVSGALQASVYAMAELASDLILGDAKKDTEDVPGAITPSELVSEMTDTMRNALPASDKVHYTLNTMHDAIVNPANRNLRLRDM